MRKFSYDAVKGSRAYPELHCGLGERVDVAELLVVIGRRPLSRHPWLGSTAVVVARVFAQDVNEVIALDDWHSVHGVSQGGCHAASTLLELFEFAAIFSEPTLLVTTGLSETIAPKFEIPLLWGEQDACRPGTLIKPRSRLRPPRTSASARVLPAMFPVVPYRFPRIGPPLWKYRLRLYAACGEFLVM